MIVVLVPLVYSPFAMNEIVFTFGVAFSIPEAQSLEPFLDALAEAGCDDAAFMGPASDGTFLAEFDRKASDFGHAVVSGIHDLREAVAGLRVLRIASEDLGAVITDRDRGDHGRAAEP